MACALTLAALLFNAPARADVYLGVGAYQSEAQVLELDDDDTTTGFTLGYVFIDSAIILSGEVGYYDLGSYSSRGVDVDADAYTVAGMASLALGPFFEVYGKLGIAAAEVEVNGRSKDGDESFTGIGFSVDVLDTLDIFVEYLDFDTEVDSELVGAGIRLQF
jgi:hypothetical protein